MEQFDCKRRFQKEDILLKDWKFWEERLFENSTGGYTTDRFAKLWSKRRRIFDAVFYGADGFLGQGFGDYGSYYEQFGLWKGNPYEGVL